MKIAVASGKGGTGKTMVAVNLARIAGDWQYVDCDVEEPNGHIFLAPAIRESERVYRQVPQVDISECSFCRACACACRYNALAVLPDRVTVHEELCHGCGLCVWVCPQRAISERRRSLGTVDTGASGPVAFVQGRLDVGEPMAGPLIRAVKERICTEQGAILDAPPGTSCPVVQSVRGCDYCLLVTEPTPFGLHDLRLAVEMARRLGLPTGVVVNKDGIGGNEVDVYCARQELPVLARIPHDRRIAEVCARGGLVVDKLPAYTRVFQRLWQTLERAVRGAPAAA